MYKTTCLLCMKEFEYLYKYHNRKYCSRKCQDAAHSQNFKGTHRKILEISNCMVCNNIMFPLYDKNG